MRTLQRREVFHVGDLSKPAAVRDSSYEGTGLSVSLHPNEWARIARLGGNTYRLIRKDGAAGRFVDMHRLSKRERAELDRLAQQAGWLTDTTVYRVKFYDSEAEEARFFEFASREAAEREADGMEDENGDPAPVEEVASFAPTDRLLTRWQQRFSGAVEAGDAARNAGWLFALEDTGRYDGSWWNDNLDPSNLSAPRGVIFQNRVAEWSAVPVTTAGEASGATAPDLSYDRRFPRCGQQVDGRRVMPGAVPNASSLSSSLDDYQELPGLREVQMQEFNTDPPHLYSVQKARRVRALAEAIRANGEIAPLIVVVDSEPGPYILEGAHRFDALKLLGARSFPAMVVLDLESLGAERPEPTVPVPSVLATGAHRSAALLTASLERAAQQDRLLPVSSRHPRRPR